MTGNCLITEEHWSKPALSWLVVLMLVIALMGLVGCASAPVVEPVECDVSDYDQMADRLSHRVSELEGDLRGALGQLEACERVYMRYQRKSEAWR
jgi:hypothetical protein